MTVLLDTHVVLWLLADDPRLGPRARDRLAAAGERLVSTASLWEIAIKVELGKLHVPDDLPTRITAAGLGWLEPGAVHTWAVRDVRGMPHRDPFDRLLLAQASVERVALMTADQALLDARLDPDVTRVDARR
ncbi:type II toxin-antitoxin system VapC family toxin [Cellulomonas wangsupingiae]|uniref:Type II toxin-antitoxin system VapC family toxin n=1 Tax=Cellulomonas wangsupingiae TaxID=2968085 RepID=A0ABY5K7K9_9CELL|nr:type II toxin-antitoxin system VapC family toxin [Cellulomonas wangsupingiae]MCC2333787.1 type II toxin-antitoxin system VapC family toxin [Cellulomonas wangsupingiae]MCM0639392.1 type II toxin-antitoxin system VapC family toxin [Cellulomonas wangsupingiae]UUI65050.1 type II toxin-antitoxin system VapC family toxin [Cellulomonas wangsupingiae]